MSAVKWRFERRANSEGVAHAPHVDPDAVLLAREHDLRCAVPPRDDVPAASSEQQR